MLTPDEIIKKIEKAQSGELFFIENSVTDEMLAGWLTDENWKVRNAAVKLIGMLKRSSFAGEIMRCMTDRTPARLLDRLLGGDYFQVGFIRRNAAYALCHIGSDTPETAQALITALQDPYWEVRAAAIKTSVQLFCRLLPLNLRDALVETLADNSFEVVMETTRALGELADNPDILKHMQKLYNHPNNLVKLAVVQALNKLFARGIIDDKEVLTKELMNIFIPGKYALNNRLK